MRKIFKQLALATAVAGVVGAAACSKPGTDSELEQDLKQANSSLEMAPQGGGTAVISAIEETPSATPAAAPKRAPAPKRATPRATPAPQRAARPVTPAPQPTRVAEKPVDTAPQPAPAAEPVTTPTVRPTAPSPRPIGQRPGTYKSEGEVLRNLPIPVNP